MTERALAVAPTLCIPKPRTVVLALARRLVPPPAVIAFGLLILAWTIAAPIVNYDRVRENLIRSREPVTIGALISGGWSLERPVLPAPHQIAADIWSSSTSASVTSRRNLLYHVWATLSASVCGLAGGLALGALLAVLLVEFRLFEAAVLPWLVASQTIPTLAIAPIVVVLLGRLGVGGLAQKALIDALIVFFPITLALIKGLRSPDSSMLDLMRTYAAGRLEILIKIRLPAALPFLFPALKVAAALSVVATIVAELPTGAEAGLGARILVGSYTGLMLVLWSAFVAASLTSAFLIGAVTLCERVVFGALGGRA